MRARRSVFEDPPLGAGWRGGVALFIVALLALALTHAGGLQLLKDGLGW